MNTNLHDAIQQLLIKKLGSDVGQSLANKYQHAFSENYLVAHDAEKIVEDIEKIEAIDASSKLTVNLIKDNHSNDHFKIRFYQLGDIIALSDILPILENFGIRTLVEENFSLSLSDNEKITVSEFSVEMKVDKEFSFEHIKPIFEKAVLMTIHSSAENDGFNRLVTYYGIDIEDVTLFRAYAKYLKQIKYRYSQAYIEKTLFTHGAIAKMLIESFYAQHSANFDPHKANELEEKIKSQLEKVKNIDDDNIIRRLLLLINATLRTNFFQHEKDGNRKPYLTYKLDCEQIPDMPLPRPLIDTFVYSTLFEGIHLRNRKVSRGGIRWSDRFDDYRTEVLGLMKAQKVKNAVIIPSGAKGGFILKERALATFGNDLKQTSIQCYRMFIRGLLDVTDNIVQGKIVKPANIICHDEDDPYFVVAADKGTADLSDYANQVSSEYGFWLGDAFASGGSNGYDHKKLGITAKGAWESLKRNLMELNRANDIITMVGVGDMSGDVFGNGLIYSDKIKLVAAFDHRHIFIDPNPNPEASFKERVRLFKLPKSSWADYDTTLISSGGGIFNRSEKSISLSPAIQQALSTSESSVTPDELIRIILKADVDVLYNGGIGTYVKATHETSENVGDKFNELCRVDGSELRCKIVCEGGNLGFTQLARVEYALKGGLINTDFIDNSAGVDCSDHEVNIKILLKKGSDNHVFNESERNTILAKLENDVCDLVLKDNYQQALIMSISSYHAMNYIDLYQDHIKQLESKAELNRKIEFLPSDEEIANRKAHGKGMTKPELAVLLAYTKIYIKDEILKSDLPENDFFNALLFNYFPKSLADISKKEMLTHYLRRDIIASYLSNSMLNTMGVTFPFRMAAETGASMSEIVTAFYLSSMIYRTDDYINYIYSLDNRVDIASQYELLHTIRMLLNMTSHWFLQKTRLQGNLHQSLEYYQKAVATLKPIVPTMIKGSTKDYINSVTEQFNKQGINDPLIAEIASARVLFTILNIAEICQSHNFDLGKAAEVYFTVGGTFNLVWFRDFIAKQTLTGKVANIAKLVLRDDIDALQRRIAILILQSDPSQKDMAQLVTFWIKDNERLFKRWQDILNETINTPDMELTNIFVAIRQLSSILDGISNTERLSLLAYHDSLTKLPNRFAISDRIEYMQKLADEMNTLFALHFIDINKFKKINDDHGHVMGDKVLVEVTKRLLSSIRSGDVAARISGDEFVVLQSNVTSSSDVEFFAKTLMAIISKPIYIGTQRFVITASVGAAIYPQHGTTAMQLIDNADKAMYETKRSQSDKVTIYSQS